MLGWSTREDVLKLYGQPNDSFEATYGGYSLKYEIDNPYDPASWRLGFDDSGILDDVMVHHQHISVLIDGIGIWLFSKKAEVQLSIILHNEFSFVIDRLIFN